MNQSGWISGKPKKMISGVVNTLPVLNPASSHSTICQFLHSHLVFQAGIFDFVEPFDPDLCSGTDED